MNDFDDIDRPEEADPLDQVINRLRNEAVPTTPNELFDVKLRRKPSALQNARIALAVVAAILFVAIVFPRKQTELNTTGETVAEIDSPPVSVVPAAQFEPYQDLETELRAMKAEIAELRRRAELLDVYQRTNSLLAKN